MKNDVLWTKTILSVYRYLERICGAIDKIIMSMALNCGDMLGQNYNINNAYSVSQKIIDLSERKVKLINLKILIEETLKEINKKDALLLIERYFNATPRKELSEKNEVSLRTIFRKIEQAENTFSKRLTIKGYGSLALSEMLKEEGWINSVYLRISSENKEDICLSNKFLSEAVAM